MENGQSFQQMVLEQLAIHSQNLELLSSLPACAKINSEWITDPNTKTKIIKFLEENVEEKSL